MNPYLQPAWSQWLRDGHHGGARLLQDLALNFIQRARGAGGPGAGLRTVGGVPGYSGLDARGFRINGESNETFVARCREIAEARLGTDGRAEDDYRS